MLIRRGALDGGAGILYGCFFRVATRSEPELAAGEEIPARSSRCSSHSKRFLSSSVELTVALRLTK